MAQIRLPSSLSCLRCYGIQVIAYMSLDIHTESMSHDVEYVGVKERVIEADIPNRVYNLWAGQ